MPTLYDSRSLVACSFQEAFAHHFRSISDDTIRVVSSALRFISFVFAT